MNTDIPLSEAMIAWNTGGQIRVLRHPIEEDDSLTKTTGACWHNWNRGDLNERLCRLMREVWIIAVQGVPAKDIHRALWVIPEYRDLVQTGMLDEPVESPALN